jgi:membrane protein involved in colicin uptake
MLEDPREALRRARAEAEDASRDAEGATKGRSKEDADKAVAAAAERARRQARSPELGELPQQEDLTDLLGQDTPAVEAPTQPAHRDQPGAHSWERPQGERKPWDQTPEG